MLRAIYLNENDVLPHIGCKAVGDAHRILFDRLGINIKHTFFKNDLWRYKQLGTHHERMAAIAEEYRPLFEVIDAIIINGEGTLHHGRGEDLLAMIGVAAGMGKRIYLINALVQEMGDYSDVLSLCDAIVTRDPFSFDEAKAYNDNVSLVPDSFVIAQFEKTAGIRASGDLFVTDYLGTMPDGPGYLVDRFLKEQDKQCQYVPFQDPFQAAKWRGIVNTLQSARCVVSARHHGLYAAAMAGRPMVALESNSHKMTAFSSMYGGIIPVVTSYDQLDDAIDKACSHEKEFMALPDLFRDKDVVGHYSDVFGLPVRAAVTQRGSNPPVKSKSLVDRVQRRLGRLLRPEAASVTNTDVHERVLAPWELTYFVDLLGARRRRDPRLLPLRELMRELSAREDTYRRYREPWDEFFRQAKARPFMVDEVSSCLPRIVDPNLLAKISALAARTQPDAGYYGVSLSAMANCAGAATPKFRIVIEHLKHALRGDSGGEVAALLDELGELNPKRESHLVNAIIPVLSELQDYKGILSLTSLYPRSEIHERNVLKVAEAHFMLGRYSSAHDLLATVKEDEELAKTADHRRGRLLVHLGKFQEGWPLMNRVVERAHFTEITSQLKLPAWSPEFGAVSKVVVWFHELGGVGGEILWGQLVLKFSVMVGCDLRLVVDPRLVVLFRKSFPHFDVVSRSEPWDRIREGADAFVFCRELTKLVISEESDFRDIARQVFKLPSVEEALPSVAGLTGKHFAISWKTTNPASAMYRNVPLDRFAELLSQFDAHYHCLQHGDIHQDTEILRHKLGDRLHTNTFDPAASVEEMGTRLLEMDGVITIDNTTLHIGGCLGIPTLVMLSIPSYWQWPAEGQWSRWYQSVQLLRQDAPGHWAGVFKQLAEELENLMSTSSPHDA